MRAAAIRTAILTGLLCMMLLPTAPRHAEEMALPKWKALRFEASKLFITAQMEVRLEPLSKDLAGTLLDSPKGRVLQVPGHPLWSVELTSSAAGRRSRSRVWFDPQTQAAFQRAKEKLGSKPYDKVSRFTRDGVYTRRRAPIDDAERGRPAEAWSKVETKFEGYPGWQESDPSKGTSPKMSTVLTSTTDDADCRAILEPSQLLYLLGAIDLAQPPTDLCIFSDGSVSKLLFEPRGETSIAIDFEETSATGTRQRKEKVKARCVVIRSQTLDGQPGGELELLGLEGDVEIFLDTSQGLPLEVRGKLPHLGNVRVGLVGVDFG